MGAGTAERRTDLLGNVAINLGLRPRAGPLPNLGNLEVYLHFCMRMFDFAVSPHLSRHPLVAAAGVGGKATAWGWIRKQIREGLRKPGGFLQGLIDKIGIVFSNYLIVLEIAVFHCTLFREWLPICARRGVLFPTAECR